MKRDQGGQDMAVLEINNIRKSFRGREVLKDISISVEEGEVIAILGPSGSGKSTLLRCATMLETMDDGSLAYEGAYACTSQDGHAVYAGKNELREIKKSFGLVFQDFNLFPHYNVLKNVCDGPVTILKKEKKEVEEYAKKLLDKLGLSDKLNDYPLQLSGGQCQRVAIARTLAMKPKIIFFDEPTSALDPEITVGILRVLRRLAEKKKTMVIVTHEISFARKVADRVIFIDKGVIVEEGRPEDVIDHPSNERTKEFLRKMEM